MAMSYMNSRQEQCRRNPPVAPKRLEFFPHPSKSQEDCSHGVTVCGLWRQVREFYADADDCGGAIVLYF
jgi:hypothetical protein